MVNQHYVDRNWKPKYLPVILDLLPGVLQYRLGEDPGRVEVDALNRAEVCFHCVEGFEKCLGIGHVADVRLDNNI